MTGTAGRRRPELWRVVPVGLIVGASIGLAGCAASETDVARSVDFITPAPPRSSTSDDTASGGGRPAGSPVTSEDAAFVSAMIVHHRQAVELARLASARAADPRVIALASTIELAQQAEADAMQSWLADHAATHADGHASMRGEISATVITRARSLKGEEFDAAFVAAMVPHHRGAVEMAENRLAGTGDGTVTRWAEGIAITQSVEADRLNEIGASLGVTGTATD